MLDINHVNGIRRAENCRQQLQTLGTVTYLLRCRRVVVSAGLYCYLISMSCGGRHLHANRCESR
jgi:hypothetical protein